MGKVENIVVIGSGCAGLTAAIYAARAQLNPLVIRGNLPGGLLTQTTEVENFPGFNDGIQGIDLMDRMQKQAQKFGARFMEEIVQKIEHKSEYNEVFLSNGDRILTKTMVIATGSKPNTLNLPQESELLGGKGLSVCATCDGFFYRNEDVCVVGGGDSACEEALYLSKMCRKVYLLHRRDTLRASKIMADRVCQHEKITVVWNSIPEGFSLNTNGFIDGLKVKNVSTEVTATLPVKGVFLAIGWKPNTQIFDKFLDLDESGYIKICNKAVCTNIPGVFAAGDCVDPFYRQACVAAGMGAQAALEAEAWLMKNNG